MRKTIFIIFVIFVIFYNHSTLLLSQETTDTTTNNNNKINFLQDALKIYIGCNSCDLDFIKEQVTFVNYVRDRSEADVHILYTTQYTGGSGKKYVVEFIGKKRYSAIIDTLTFITENNETEKVVREKVVKILKLGLVQYVSKTPLSKYLEISFAKNEEKKDEGEKKIKDKWNSWVFSISANTWLNGNDIWNSQSLYGNFQAKRITEESKIYIGSWGNYNRSFTDYGDGDTYTNTSDSKGGYASIVKSIDSNWSYGVWLEGDASEFRNIYYAGAISSGIEYNFFPYSESNKRDFRFQYKIIPKYNNYLEETIFGKTSEILLKHSFAIETEFVKEWGEINIDFKASNYLMIGDRLLKDIEKYKLSLYASTDINIFKGFSLNIRGDISRVHDQITIRKGDLTQEEMLTKQKEQQVDYEYWGSVGFSYTFGSIYNNIVNPRF